jgi:hypothetical protein
MPWLWDSPTHSLPPLSPILPVSLPNKSPSGRSRRLIPGLCRSGAMTFFLITTACVSIVYLGLVLWSGRPGPPNQLCVSAPPVVSSAFPFVPSVPQLVSSAPQLASPAAPQRNHNDDSLHLEELRDLVAKTTGYFVRDYSLGLGWNNVCCRD